MSSIFTGRTLLALFRWGIFALACGSLWWQLRADKGTLALEVLRALPGDARAMRLVVVALLLVPVNWGIEAWKWRCLVRGLEPVGMGRALLATVAGTSIGIITPNRTGEFLGRVLFLAPDHRVQGAFATALGSIAQFVVTLLAGGASLFLLSMLGHAMPWPDGWIATALISLTAIVAAGSLFFYLYPALLRQLLLTLPFLGRLERASAVLNTYRLRTLLEVLAWSALRYLVFTLQFVLLCRAFQVGVPVVSTLLVIPVVYLVATLVPTVLLSELGVRGTTALAFFMPLGAAASGVLLATTALWTMNLLLPAVIGGIILVTARIRTGEANDP